MRITTVGLGAVIEAVAMAGFPTQTLGDGGDTTIEAVAGVLWPVANTVGVGAVISHPTALPPPDAPMGAAPSADAPIMGSPS